MVVALALALAAGSALGMAAPAHALTTEPTGGVTGHSQLYDAADDSYVFRDLHIDLYDQSHNLLEEAVGDPGYFGSYSFDGIADGLYTVEAHSGAVITEPYAVDVSVMRGEVNQISDIRLTQATIDVSNVSVDIVGSPIVGSTLTAGTTGWPEGTTLGYQWARFGMTGMTSIPDATDFSVVIPEDALTLTMAFRVWGHLDGYKDFYVDGRMDSPVAAAVTEAAPAPDPDPTAVSTADPVAAPVSESSGGVRTGDSPVTADGPSAGFNPLPAVGISAGVILLLGGSLVFIRYRKLKRDAD